MNTTSRTKAMISSSTSSDLSSDDSRNDINGGRPSQREATNGISHSTTSLEESTIDIESTKKAKSTKKTTTGTQLKEPSKFSIAYTNFIVQWSHRPLLYCMKKLSCSCAKYPWRTIFICSFASIAMLLVGFNTGFELYSGPKQWIPTNSPTDKYLQHVSKFNFTKEGTRPAREFFIMLHKNGDNVLTKDSVELVFNTTEYLFNLPGYRELCDNAGNVNLQLPNGTDVQTCFVSGIMRFWWYQKSFFTSNVLNDTDVITDMSVTNYPDGGRVLPEILFGLPKYDPTTGLLSSVLSYPWVVSLPAKSAIKEANLDYDIVKTERMFLNELLALSDSWQNDPRTRGYRLELTTWNSFEDEFERGVLGDLFLVPYVFVLMTLFSCGYFYRSNKVQSKCLLGLGATASVLISVFMGYGIMFAFNVPFTTMTSMIPFIMFGVGLDDAFILVDTYERTDPTKDPVDRVNDTIQESGISITMTTVSSTFAFASGMISTIPSVRWLCYYSAPTILMVLLFQITFFVACIVIDDRRIRSNRRDCCLCIRVQPDENVDTETCAAAEYDSTKTFSYVAMKSYSDFILTPRNRFLIIINFLCLMVLCTWSATQLKQEFDFNDVLPTGSYLIRGVEALLKYRGNSAVRPTVYFRNVDFLNTEIQDQMENFVNDIVTELDDFVSAQPSKFWLRDFRKFSSSNTVANGIDSNTTISNATLLDLRTMTFEQQVKLFLNDTVYGDLYKSDFGFNREGTKILHTKVTIEYDKVLHDEVVQQIDALQRTEELTNQQPINARLDPKEHKFFVYTQQFNAYAFSASCVPELISNTIVSMASITVVTVAFIPHWTAPIFVLPIVIMMYADILGILQWSDVPINAVSLVALVMSIGLIVDYLMHVFLRYHETPGKSRQEKVTITMCTMGASVLAGGLSTFLGTLPIAFSETGIFWILFVSFCALVVVALAHGLILLPVLLATFGPEENSVLRLESNANGTTTSTSTSTSSGSTTTGSAVEA